MPAVLAPLQAHLGLIKRRLFIIGATIIVCFALCFIYAPQLIDWLSRPFIDANGPLNFYAPAEGLFAAMKIAFMASLVLSLPMMLYQFWKFVEPALLPREQRMAIPLFLLAGGLFLLGVVFCNMVILPRVIDFFVGIGTAGDLMPVLGVGLFVDFNVKFMLIMGFGFEIPLVLTILARIGYVSHALLSRYRKHAMLAILILSAILTPEPGMYTTFLMAVPLMVMYELGILGARLFERPRVSDGTDGSGGEGGRSDEDDAGASEGETSPSGTAGYRVR